MNVAIQAVKFYCYETGYPWSQFYDKLDEALASDAEGGELWLIKKLMKVIEQHGISVHLFKANKDAVRVSSMQKQEIRQVSSSHLKFGQLRQELISISIFLTGMR